MNKSVISVFAVVCSLGLNAQTIGNSPYSSYGIGDTKYDIDAAKEVGIDSVAALYGYGSPEEIASANYSIQKPLDLLSLV